MLLMSFKYITFSSEALLTLVEILSDPFARIQWTHYWILSSCSKHKTQNLLIITTNFELSFHKTLAPHLLI